MQLPDDMKKGTIRGILGVVAILAALVFIPYMLS